MFFLSGTFFPLTRLPYAAQIVAMAVLPLTHVVNISRAVVTTHLEPILGLNSGILAIISLAWIIVVSIFFFIVSINLMKKRLTG
jgi:lipooligosaccharide transport system permease protein